VTLLAAALRLDALTSKYGEVTHPAWVRVLTRDGAAIGRHLHPARMGWAPVAHPYVGGDPYSYLRFAREMRSFYQAHVREPVFLALTRGWLWLLSDRDIGISYASALASTLLVFGAYLLGAAAFSRWVGLFAALAIAIDYQVIDWSVDGWRDDTYACAFTFAAWAFVRLHKRPSVENALLAGVLAALACLTRITAALFVLPALAWIVVEALPGARAAHARASLAALLITGVLVAPYLINCARATGDPLYAIDYHTRFYRFGEGLPSDRPMSAATYVTSKVRDRPVATLDSVTTGIFVWPLDAKGTGLDWWVPGLRGIFIVSASVGLVVLALTPTGRLLLVVLFSSLVPYAFTWNIKGGGEWRFTLHAYPVYLVAGCALIAALIQWSVTAVRTRTPPWKSMDRQRVVQAVAIAAVVLFGMAAYRQLPYFVVREAVYGGTPVSVVAGERDNVFFASGWSEAHQEGNVSVRISTSDRADMWIPLPTVRGYELAIRLDPVSPAAQHSVVVLLNGRMLGRERLTWDPQRVGSYRFGVGSDHVRPGANRLTLVAEPAVPASIARERHPWLDGSGVAGIRLWYVRVQAQ
jgi:hypothetical protein